MAAMKPTADTPSEQSFKDSNEQYRAALVREMAKFKAIRDYASKRYAALEQAYAQTEAVSDTEDLRLELTDALNIHDAVHVVTSSEPTLHESGADLTGEAGIETAGHVLKPETCHVQLTGNEARVEVGKVTPLVTEGSIKSTGEVSLTVIRKDDPLDIESYLDPDNDPDGEVFVPSQFQRDMEVMRAGVIAAIQNAPEVLETSRQAAAMVASYIAGERVSFQALVAHVIEGSDEPITATEIRDKLEARGIDLDARFKAPLSVIHTILGRLVKAEKILPFESEGSKKAYIWNDGRHRYLALAKQGVHVDGAGDADKQGQRERPDRPQWISETARRMVVDKLRTRPARPPEPDLPQPVEQESKPPRSRRTTTRLPDQPSRNGDSETPTQTPRFGLGSLKAGSKTRHGIASLGARGPKSSTE